MKRTFCIILGMVLATTFATAQSLGDVARKQRQQKKPAATRVYSNEDLPTSAPINIGGSATAEETKPAEENVTEPKTGEKTEGATPSAPEDLAKVATEWRAKADEQKKAISLLERELDVMQREYKQRIAAYYWDAGNRLRDDRRWADEERKYQADLADKQKQLAEARQKLDDLREEARKAGAPGSATE